MISRQRGLRIFLDVSLARTQDRGKRGIKRKKERFHAEPRNFSYIIFRRKYTRLSPTLSFQRATVEDIFPRRVHSRFYVKRIISGNRA